TAVARQICNRPSYPTLLSKFTNVLSQDPPLVRNGMRNGLQWYRPAWHTGREREVHGPSFGAKNKAPRCKKQEGLETAKTAGCGRRPGLPDGRCGGQGVLVHELAQGLRGSATQAAERAGDIVVVQGLCDGVGLVELLV